jgi:hypothetical protein
VITYRLRVEQGVTVDGHPVDGAHVAREVHRILIHRRGWERIDRVRFTRVASRRAEVDIVLATGATTDRLCAPLETNGKLSCYQSGVIVLNARRWFAGARTYGKDLANYRRYLVSHEMGHHLGHPHERCPSRRAIAPVMLQQTKYLRGCRIGPWPRR